MKISLSISLATWVSFVILQSCLKPRKTKFLFNFCVFVHATGLFLYPLETSENQGFSDVFRVIGRDQWYEMGSLKRPEEIWKKF